MNYFLEVGQSGSIRLNLLNKVLEESTKNFLKKFVKPGDAVLELGCGTGNVTRILSELVGERGSVIATDISAEQLRVAEDNTDNFRYKNVRYVLQDAKRVSALADNVDVVYGRLVLMHIQNPRVVIEAILSAMKVGAFMAFEEASNSLYYHYPSNGEYRRFREGIVQLSSYLQLDSMTGLMLPEMYVECRLRIEFVNSFYLYYMDGVKEKIITALFDEIFPRLRDHGIYSHEDYATSKLELERFCKADESLITFPLLTQVYGVKK